MKIEQLRQIEKKQRELMTEMILLDETYRITIFGMTPKDNHVDVKHVWNNKEAEDRFNVLVDEYSKLNDQIMEGLP